ncbi:MAG TPA: YeiH family protein [Paucimonas sp.]|nr:YeiH family protein [Paucimonas sp.]
MRASLTATTASGFSGNGALRLGAGLLLSAAVASAALGAAQLAWCREHGIGALTLAILFGIVVGNTVYPRLAPVAAPGIQFARQTLLRLGIVLYGFRLSFADLVQVGWAGMAVDVLVLASTFGLAAWVGIRVLKLEPETALLIGAGNAICGAAAIMATEPVVRARSEQAALAVAMVVVFGTLAMISYPALYHVLQACLPGAVTPQAFGIYAGSTVHEVAQVVAIGRTLGEEAAGAAIVAKMMRVMMLAPFLLVLAAYVARRDARGRRDPEARRERRIAIPWFAFLFIAVIALHSAAPLAALPARTLVAIDDALLATAMAALGCMTQIAGMRRAGAKCLALAAILFAWLVAGGAALNWAVLRY